MWQNIAITILFLSLPILAGSQNSQSADIGRPMAARVSFVKGNRSQPPQIIFDTKAWNVAKCQQRMASNPYDGDARFIVAWHSLLQKEYEKAAELFTLTIPLRYKDFSENAMTEGLGCAYNELGKAAKRRQAAADYLASLQKEQSAYSPLCQSGSNRDSLFCYLYALTYIDLGTFLAEQKQKGQQAQVFLPDIQKPLDSRSAYEKASQILESIQTPDSKVFDQLIMVYKRLGLTEKAEAAAKRQSEAARKALFIRQRDPVRQSILKSLKPQDVLTASFKSQYTEIFRQKYSTGQPQQSDQARIVLRAMVQSIVQASRDAASLSAEN
jgi:hypothetical protein